MKCERGENEGEEEVVNKAVGGRKKGGRIKR